MSGPGLSVVNWDRTTIAGSVGTFTDDPFGIGDNATLTTGPASGALPVGDGSIDNQGGASQDYCSAGSKDASVIYAGLLLDAGYNGLRIEFVFATNKPVGISIFSFTNGLEQIARFNGQNITSQSSIAKSPNAIFIADSVTGYSKSTAPLVVTLLAVPYSQADLYIVVCDQGDSGNDSAFLIKGRACSDCESTPGGAEINYVKQTTTHKQSRPRTQCRVLSITSFTFGSQYSFSSS
ncbi:hypothetical protein FPOA_05811 [Fusarium poae]|uniref:Uncharacterized protein n=1 Tax=Fusarium poae TaxID=36050 RepID=A0A1B8AXS0_FUSPO|nr:hypothetical protein FPOA_05811 [Fusarium poae]